MCRRFQVLFYINKKTINDIFLFLSKSTFIYYFLVINSLYNIIAYYLQKKIHLFIYSIFSFILFLAFIYFFKLLTKNNVTTQENSNNIITENSTNNSINNSSNPNPTNHSSNLKPNNESTNNLLTDNSNNNNSKNILILIFNCIVTVSLITLLYLFEFIYLCIEQFQYFLLINFISILIQISTIYILLKLRSKIIERDQLVQNNLEADHV